MNVPPGPTNDERPTDSAKVAGHAPLDEVAPEGARGDDGCDATLEALWSAYGKRLILTGIGKQGLAKSDAEDVAQITFARMRDSWSAFDGQNAAGWMWELWRYEVRTRRQSRRRYDARHDGDGEIGHLASRDNTASPSERAELREVLDAVRAELDPVDRILFDGLGEKTHELELIAQIAGETGKVLTGVAVRKRRQRLRTRISAQLLPLGFP